MEDQEKEQLPEAGKGQKPGLRPPSWPLMVLLCLCLLLGTTLLLDRSGFDRSKAAGLPSRPDVATRRAEAWITKTPPPTPTPTEPDETEDPEKTGGSDPGETEGMAAVAVPEGEAQDLSWFSDAVLIGDSRMNGFQLYSDVTEAHYITCTGLSIYKVAEEEKLIRWGEEKISVLEALKKGTYGKVYLSMGVNELGYYNPEGFAETFGKVIDRVREIQPGAEVYVMTIIPVNSELCREYKQFDYVNNTLVEEYNTALVDMAKEKDVYLVNVSEALVDETGEPPKELSSDGVHFQKEGYLRWRDYLLCHTGAGKGETE